jgi:hypothetical protein
MRHSSGERAKTLNLRLYKHRNTTPSSSIFYIRSHNTISRYTNSLVCVPTLVPRFRNANDVHLHGIHQSVYFINVSKSGAQIHVKEPKLTKSRRRVIRLEYDITNKISVQGAIVGSVGCRQSLEKNQVGIE